MGVMDFKLEGIKVQLDQFSVTVDCRYVCIENMIEILNGARKNHAQKILISDVKVSKVTFDFPCYQQLIDHFLQ